LTNFSANVARSHVASLFVAGGAWSALRVFFLMTQPISCIFAKRMEFERRQCYCTEVQWYAVSKPPRDCESQKTVMCFSNDGIFSFFRCPSVSRERLTNMCLIWSARKRVVGFTSRLRIPERDVLFCNVQFLSKTLLTGSLANDRRVPMSS